MKKVKEGRDAMGFCTRRHFLLSICTLQLENTLMAMFCLSGVNTGDTAIRQSTDSMTLKLEFCGKNTVTQQNGIQVPQNNLQMNNVAFPEACTCSVQVMTMLTEDPFHEHKTALLYDINI
uniref:CSON001683 protein n=1 Tax=Culicoides sonorensis TaxID=179676 RepID=A0A336LR49_CULSO